MDMGSPSRARDGAVPLLQHRGAAPADDGDLHRILESMPAAFCFLDRTWCFRRINAEAERLLGVAREDVLGRSVWNVIPGLVGTVFESSYREAFETGEPVSFESRTVTGRAGWYEVRAWPMPDGLAIYALDVSERRRVQEAALRATARMTLLAEVSTQLSGALDGESALGRLARLVVPTLTDACIVTVVDREGRARDVGSWHRDPERVRLLEQYTAVRLDSLPPSSPLGRALQGATPVIEPVSTVLQVMRPGPSRDLLVELGPEIAVVLPLTSSEGRTVGVLTLYQDRGRAVGEDDLAVALDVATQAGRAIDRVHRQSQQAKLAEGLQRSLLTDPPEIPGASVIVRYVPAAEAARVGGDWYDAFLQLGGAPVLVIGDVVGHDTAAAAAMGQLRGLLRGIAHYGGAGPAEILRGLDEAIASMHTGTLATAAVARLEPADDGPTDVLARLRWANAGHPPPALVTADGAVRLLVGEEFDLMLGVDHDVRRAEHVVPLQPGATVLLYTDGLIERRGRTLDEGFDRLCKHLTELAGRPVEQLSDELLDRMLPGTPQDDVAMVAIALDPPEQCRARRTSPDWDA